MPNVPAKRYLILLSVCRSLNGTMCLPKESWPYNEGDGYYERRKKVKESLVNLSKVSARRSCALKVIGTHFLEDSQLRTNLPPTQLPREKDVLHEVVIKTIDEEKVPPHESLFEDGHLAEATSCTAAAEEDGARGLGFDKDRGAHRDSRAEHASDVAEEPVLAYGETRMVKEGLFEEFNVPETDRAVRARAC